MSRQRPNVLNARRIVAAAKSGTYRNMACIARDVGVSRERVRQVLNATGHTNFGPRQVRLQWPCPDCGETIDTTASVLRAQSHMLAHCRKCAKNYCRRGHLRSEHARKNGSCRVCVGNQMRRIVEVRTCLECRNDLEISRGTHKQIRLGKTRGEFHLKCYFAYMRREGRLASRKPVA